MLRALSVLRKKLRVLMVDLPVPLVHNQVSTDDPDLLRDIVSWSTMRVDRLSPSSSPSRFEQIQSAAGWALDMAEIQSKLSVEGAFPPGYGGVMLVMKAAGTSFCGFPLADGMLITIPEGIEMEVAAKPGFLYAGIAVPASTWLAAQIDERGFVRDDPARGLALRRLPPSRQSITESQLARAVGLIRDSASGMSGPTDASVAVQDYVAWLARDLADLDEEPLTKYSGHLIRVATQARDWIHAHIDRPIRIVDLCRAVAVSRRRLEYAFREVYDISPREYVESLRLNEIRRVLLGPATRELSITDVAFEHGINHLGRFAASYRTLFDELPSQTLSATRGRGRGRELL